MKKADRNARIRGLAETQYRGKEFQFDIGSKISEGNGNGAWVACWVWADFGGTELDKDPMNPTAPETPARCAKCNLRRDQHQHGYCPVVGGGRDSGMVWTETEL